MQPAKTPQRRTTLLAVLLLISGCADAAGPGPTPPPPLPPPPPPPAPPPSGSIAMLGAVGCSMTGGPRGALQGLQRLDTPATWSDEVIDPYGGGDLESWAGESGNHDGSRYWDAFEAGLAEAWPDAIWWQICSRGSGESSQQQPGRDTLVTQLDQRQVQTVSDRIRDLAPGVPVYVSPLADYEPQGLCALALPGDGPAISRNIARWAVEAGLAEFAGPVLDPLPLSLLITDNCHMNVEGQNLQGGALSEFFTEGEG